MQWNDGTGYEKVEEAHGLTGGPEYFTLLEKLISEAQQSISLFVYILTPDETGLRVLELLKAAARRKLNVFLLVDDFGSDEIHAEMELELLEAGIRFNRFEPVFSTSNLYIGRRMHAKVLVVDGTRALVGGINIANRYRGTASETAWLDYAVYLSGTLAAKIERSCFGMLHPLQSVRVPQLTRVIRKSSPVETGSLLARIRINDFLRNRREIARSYNNAVRNAQKSVTIIGGYFLPGRKFRKLLRNAARRQVTVSIIMTQKSDVPVTRLASEYLYGKLLRGGVHIYEYRPSMVHGKAAVVDARWATIGSYNQNQLSAYLSIELNIDIVSNAFGSAMEASLQQLIRQDCNEIKLEEYADKAGAWTKLKRWTAYRMVQISLRLLFLVNRVSGVDD